MIGDSIWDWGGPLRPRLGLSQGDMPMMVSGNDWGPGLANTVQRGVPAGTSVDPCWGVIVIVAWATQLSMWFSLFPGGSGKVTVYLSVSLSSIPIKLS